VKNLERVALEGEQVRAEGVLRENRLGWKALEGEQVRAEGVRGTTD